MSDVHLHLIVNHVPILGTLFALVLGLYGGLRRQPDVIRAAFLALIVSGVGSFVALRTGEGAEERVEHLAGVSERMIHEHEEAAEVAHYGAVALALVALGVLGWRRKEPTIGLPPTAVVLVGAALVFALMARAGNLGGQIRHTELATSASSVSSSEDARSSAYEREEHDDDD